MPTSTKRTVDSSANSPVKSSAQGGGGSSSKLRSITPEEADAWTAALHNQASSNFEFMDLDECHEHIFKVCWIHSLQRSNLNRYCNF